MKRIISFMSTVTIMAMLTTTLSLTSCKKESQALNSRNASALSEQQTAPYNVALVHAAIHIEDASMQPPAGDATLLWDNRGHTPIMAPEGHQITLGEFNRVSGYAEVKCVNAGTHVVVHVQGLIPNGIYTIWVLTFKSPGFDGTFVNLIGNGALGAPDGSQNAFKASSDGTASLSVIVPAKSLSLFGSVTNCLSDEFEVHLAAAYHSDNLTHGGSPGDPSTWVVQFAFPFFGGF